MNAAASILGLGSSHGDDRIGWEVIDALDALDLPSIDLFKLRSPIQLIDHLIAGGEVHLVDAAIGLARDQQVLRLRGGLSADRLLIDSLTSQSTHALGIGEVLKLAAALQVDLAKLTLWYARAESFASLAPPSETARESIATCTRTLLDELVDARTIAR